MDDNMTDDKVWQVMKERAVLLIRGSIVDMAQHDISHLDDGSEYIFAILKTEIHE